MDSTVTNNTAESETEQGSAKHGPKLYGGIAALVLVVVAAVVAAPKLSHEAPVSAAAPTTVVTVAQPLQRDLHGRLQFLGQFSPVDQVELRAQVGGTLTYIGFKDGDVVRKGALLFTIDPTPYQIKFDEGTAQIATARARLELAKTELARAQTLQKTDAGTLRERRATFCGAKIGRGGTGRGRSAGPRREIRSRSNSCLCAVLRTYGNPPRVGRKSCIRKPRRR